MHLADAIFRTTVCRQVREPSYGAEEFEGPLATPERYDEGILSGLGRTSRRGKWGSTIWVSGRFSLRLRFSRSC